MLVMVEASPLSHGCHHQFQVSQINMMSFQDLQEATKFIDKSSTANPKDGLQETQEKAQTKCDKSLLKGVYLDGAMIEEDIEMKMHITGIIMSQKKVHLGGTVTAEDIKMKKHITETMLSRRKVHLGGAMTAEDIETRLPITDMMLS
jgi:hypothetical protein